MGTPARLRHGVLCAALLCALSVSCVAGSPTYISFHDVCFDDLVVITDWTSMANLQACGNLAGESGGAHRASRHPPGCVCTSGLRIRLITAQCTSYD